MSFFERFEGYFEQPVAKKAAKSLSNGAEIGLKIGSDCFTFTKENGENQLIASAPKKPQITFVIPELAAEQILSRQTNEIGEIGVHIAQLILSQDPAKKVQIQLHTGVIELLTKGYFGVIAAGGSSFASFLASKGLKSVGAIRTKIKEMRKTSA